VLPRVLATMLMLADADAARRRGGHHRRLFIGITVLDLPAGFYMNDVLTSLTLEDVWSGLGKALVFGYFIAIVACRNGLRVEAAPTASAAPPPSPWSPAPCSRWSRTSSSPSSSTDVLS
jgi:phospholipid/cholesterol/gamma-HCH transport system permease protein